MKVYRALESSNSCIGHLAIVRLIHNSKFTVAPANAFPKSEQPNILSNHNYPHFS